MKRLSANSAASRCPSNLVGRVASLLPALMSDLMDYPSDLRNWPLIAKQHREFSDQAIT